MQIIYVDLLMLTWFVSQKLMSSTLNMNQINFKKPTIIETCGLAMATTEACVTNRSLSKPTMELIWQQWCHRNEEECPVSMSAPNMFSVSSLKKLDST